MDEFKKETELQDESEVLLDTDDTETIEPELEDIEHTTSNKIKDLQAKLKVCEHEKMEHLENLQRAKAEFLNSKRRLEDERTRDKERAVNAQIEKLLPLCDSFYMAMANTEAWEAIDATWRTGMEGINNQLHDILASYGVTEQNPQGQTFDPALHDAMANIPVTDEALNHKIISVIQNGFIRTINGKQELIRPARVTVGEYTQS